MRHHPQEMHNPLGLVVVQPDYIGSFLPTVKKLGRYVALTFLKACITVCQEK